MALMNQLPALEAPRLALISGRNANNPRLLTESIAKDCNCIYLENIYGNNN